MIKPAVFLVSGGADTRHLSTSVQLSIFILLGLLRKNFRHDHSEVRTLTEGGIYLNRSPVLLDNIIFLVMNKPSPVPFLPFEE